MTSARQEIGRTMRFVYYDEVSPEQAAEVAAIEAATGDTIRAALRPYLDALHDVHPDGARDLLADLGATGADWISTFLAPIRFGWRSQRYPKEVHAQIVALIDQLDGLQNRAAFTYHRASEPL